MATSLDLAQTYSSYSGVDISVILNGNKIGSMQAISYAIQREKAPIYVMGRVDPRSFSRGKRGIAGTMICLLLDKHLLFDEAFKDEEAILDRDEIITVRPDGIDFFMESFVNQIDQNYISSKLQYIDQVLPFDVSIVAVNEYGQAAQMRMYGCEILNEGSGFSIDDMTVENQMTYVARAILPWQSFRIDTTASGSDRTSQFFNSLRESLERSTPGSAPRNSSERGSPENPGIELTPQPTRPNDNTQSTDIPEDLVPQGDGCDDIVDEINEILERIRINEAGFEEELDGSTASLAGFIATHVGIRYKNVLIGAGLNNAEADDVVQCITGIIQTFVLRRLATLALSTGSSLLTGPFAPLIIATLNIAAAADLRDNILECAADLVIDNDAFSLGSLAAFIQAAVSLYFSEQEAILNRNAIRNDNIEALRQLLEAKRLELENCRGGQDADTVVLETAEQGLTAEKASRDIYYVLLDQYNLLLNDWNFVNIDKINAYRNYLKKVKSINSKNIGDMF